MERSHFSPGECWAVGTCHLSEHPSPTEADGTEYEILVGWIFDLPCCLDIYYHRHIMVLRALVMMVLSGSKYYAGNLMAIINILKDKAQFPFSGWDVKYKSYKRKVQ